MLFNIKKIRETYQQSPIAEKTFLKITGRCVERRMQALIVMSCAASQRVDYVTHQISLVTTIHVLAPKCGYLGVRQLMTPSVLKGEHTSFYRDTNSLIVEYSFPLAR